MTPPMTPPLADVAARTLALGRALLDEARAEEMTSTDADAVDADALRELTRGLALVLRTLLVQHGTLTATAAPITEPCARCYYEPALGEDDYCATCAPIAAARAAALAADEADYQAACRRAGITPR